MDLVNINCARHCESGGLDSRRDCSLQNVTEEDRQGNVKGYIKSRDGLSGEEEDHRSKCVISSDWGKWVSKKRVKKWNARKCWMCI